MESTERNEGASVGLAGTGLGLGAGALGLMLLQNGAFGGLFGGQRPAAPALATQNDLDNERALTGKDMEIANLKSQLFTNEQVTAVERRLTDKIEAVEAKITVAAQAQAVLNAKQEAFIGSLAAQVASFDAMTAKYIKAPVMAASEAAMSVFKPAAATATAATQG